MTRLHTWLATTALCAGLLSTPAAQAQDTPSDTQIRELLIADSIEAYEGNCPCPYSRASNGSRCGKRSAWSRPGGASPLCYASDVSEAMVATARARGTTTP